MTTTIRRWVETDTGHRVPNHSSKCAHLHGHSCGGHGIRLRDHEAALFAR